MRHHHLICISLLAFLVLPIMPLSAALMSAVSPPDALVGTLSLKSKRCSDQSFVFTAFPEQLAGRDTMAFKRGSDAAAFSGAAISLAEDAVVYLFVQRRGNAGIPAPWQKIKAAAMWKAGSTAISDDVYRLSCPAGELTIPGHAGKEGAKYGVPHLVVAARAADDIEFGAAPGAVIKTRWAPQREPQPSRIWDEFRTAVKQKTASVLPDFSYAGYRQGAETIQVRGRQYTVTDYGAVPDDTTDDGAAIQKTIDDCAAHGGGIVYLPAGRYVMNTSMAARNPIDITNSSIVIKGAGAISGGTIIHQIHPFETGVPPSDQKHYHLGKSLFNIRSRGEDKPQPDVADVTGFIPDNAFVITVNTPAALAPGMYVLLRVTSADLMKRLLAPRQADVKWENLEKNPQAAELHIIASVDGNRVTFREPIRYPARASDGWKIRPVSPIHDVGIEDICFMGNAYAKYVHHRNDIEDSGWASISMRGVTDGWIRRCSFIDVNQMINISRSSYVSMLNLFVLGNQGHHIPRVGTFSYGVFGGLIEDRANFTHGPSVSQMAVGTVYWRCSISPAQPIDSHAGRPFVTLFDRIDGGSLFGSTGGLRDFPQHLRKLVIWNFRHGVVAKDNKPFVYDFWHNANTGIFLDPIIVGIHGTPAEFNEETVERLESIGTPVNPESLYEAQLELRLGAAPAWIAEARRENAALRSAKFPAHFDRRDAVSMPITCIETFRLDDALKFVTERAMRMFGKEFFTYTIDDRPVEVSGDQVLLRHAIYTAMAAVYTYSKEGNSIAVTKIKSEGADMIRMIVSSGDIRSEITEDVTVNDDYRDVVRYAKILRGTAQFVKIGKGIQVELTVPVK
ncbi:MAG: DUF4955 domain-containing protein [Spirochaetes bacterium]|nr:DUF4955 domain-containing protein [Spirochaetota bacterium]